MTKHPTQRPLPLKPKRPRPTLAYQRALPLKHRRWRPTAEYAHRLERELMLARMEIGKLNERLAWWAAEYRKIQRLAA